jgi:hypothetical protein
MGPDLPGAHTHPVPTATVAIPTEEIASLARQLVRVRRMLESEAPHSPAWAATSGWVDELEDRVRSLGFEPDALAGNVIWLSSRRAPHHI